MTKRNAMTVDYRKAHERFDEAFAGALQQMDQDGLIALDGKKVKLTEKGRLKMAEIKDRREPEEV